MDSGNSNRVEIAQFRVMIMSNDSVIQLIQHPARKNEQQRLSLDFHLELEISNAANWSEESFTIG